MGECEALENDKELLVGTIVMAIAHLPPDLLQLSTMTLATANAAGAAHAAPVYFAACQNPALPLELYFFSAPDSRHAQDLAASPHAAAAIYPETMGWEDIRGLQMHGMVRQLSAGTAWDAAWLVYLEKFPFTGEMKAVISRNLLYALCPSWVRLVDNRQGFGFKQEWNLHD
jgi:hypothetical protein